MVVRGSGCVLAAALLGVLGCNARALDPGMDPTMTGTGGTSPPPDPVVTTDLVSQLRMVSGPDQMLIVGVNGGAVTSVSTHGPISQFVNDPEALVEAAAVVGMKVCSVELQTLALGQPGNVTSVTMLGVPDALDMCLKENLGDMPARVAQLKTPSMVVVVASNTAITVHSTNGGINYFYGTDIVDLLHAAREVYVPVCFVMSGPLALPTPEGQSAGASVDEALAACGRS